ncbi:MAG: hypothetical protein GWM90_28235 [Gemmatimonadetes bacterium]|nr:hypothetical protein [Gemmatimonadota bacterium]NIQ58917.1 hypothetical protein [Gemmatimonadota bacterium]NIU79102.1 hypothetical protein [Gammaproteobacteria bacterium]NIX47817.1 hypothetical protein [Gemmatimonadota bacterium]NIY12177.1 hypothetical protein [Gemmatimonadota bacterium]
MERRHTDDSDSLPPEARVRDEDLEPFSALRYIARLFKVLAVLALMLLIAEAALGFAEAGTAALANLLVEAYRLIVFAALLWAAGDISLMLVETNHDLRATRILVARLHHQIEELGASLARRRD